MWFTLIADIIETLISGELQAWLKNRREAKASQEIANAPSTKDELDARLKNHDF
jgi:hypothetical protein